MDLKIENVGPINNADISFGKLNIVGGINGSGKSTSSRLLYCFLLSASQDGDKIYDECAFEELKSIFDNLKEGINGDFNYNLGDYTKSHFELSRSEVVLFNRIENKFLNEFQNNDKKIMEILYDLNKFIKFLKINSKAKNFYNRHIDAINEGLQNSDEVHRFYIVLRYVFTSVFGYRPDIDLYGKGTATFSMNLNGDEKASWTLYVGEDGFEYNVQNKDLCPTFLGNVIYIDSISPLEVLRFRDALELPHNFELLFEKLSVDPDEVHIEDKEYLNKLVDVQEHIDYLINGEFGYDTKEFAIKENLGDAKYIDGFSFTKDEKTYNMKNSSSGLKQIGTIQMLLNNKQLKENDFLIIDEPEVNLHPEWQVRLAEILVLLIKEINISIYINSHSPHFIEALEVFSVKYGIEDETRFYLNEFDEETKKFNFKQLQYANVRELYRNLGNPYNEINRTRIRNDLRDI